VILPAALPIVSQGRDRAQRWRHGSWALHAARKGGATSTQPPKEVKPTVRAEPAKFDGALPEQALPWRLRAPEGPENLRAKTADV